MSKKALLDQILGSAKEAGRAPVVQLLLGVQLIEGALSVNEEFPDLYIVHGPQELAGQTVMAFWTFSAEDVTAVAAFQPMETSRIATPFGEPKL